MLFRGLKLIPVFGNIQGAFSREIYSGLFSRPAVHLSGDSSNKRI